MRDLLVVLQQIKDHIPESEKYMHARISSMQSSVSFASPEMQPDFWREFSLCLQEWFPSEICINKEWHKRIFEIWLDNPDRFKNA